MVSDTKTRGFNLEHSPLRRADRIERLILILALALYWAVSTGMWDAINNPSAAEKKAPEHRPRRYARSLLSLFKRGLRRLLICLVKGIPPPTLWAAWQTDSWRGSWRSP